VHIFYNQKIHDFWLVSGEAATDELSKSQTMTWNRITISALMLFLMVTGAWSQTSSVAPDFMRSQGKLFVVVAVIAAIFLGITAFLVYLDRRLTKLENQIKEADA